MFTGIIQTTAKVKEIQTSQDFMHLSLLIPAAHLEGLKRGASVAVNGVCLTVVAIQNNLVSFDVIAESLARTTLKDLILSQRVNIERSAKFGDEIGGHMLSGHIFTTAQITKISSPSSDQKIISFKGPEIIGKYLFPKGYIALNGASLTLVDASRDGSFSVHLIPETLRATTFGTSIIGESVNVEIDSQTQTIVQTVENVMAARFN